MERVGSIGLTERQHIRALHAPRQAVHIIAPGGKLLYRAGFWSAMASNVTFQSQNVQSKKLMIKKEESLDNINLFSIITAMSFFPIGPCTLSNRRHQND